MRSQTRPKSSWELRAVVAEQELRDRTQGLRALLDEAVRQRDEALLLHQETRGTVAALKQRVRELETANADIAEHNQGDYGHAFAEVEAQRDDLLEALRLIINTAELGDMSEWVGVDVAREAIAKVESRQ